MALETDYTGGSAETAKAGDSDIVGAAGQTHRGADKPGSEQIAAWGGITDAETSVNETGERAVEGKYLDGQPNG